MTPGDFRWFSIACDLHETNCPKLKKMIWTRLLIWSSLITIRQAYQEYFQKLENFWISKIFQNFEIRHQWKISEQTACHFNQVRSNETESCPNATISDGIWSSFRTNDDILLAAYLHDRDSNFQPLLKGIVLCCLICTNRNGSSYNWISILQRLYSFYIECFRND